MSRLMAESSIRDAILRFSQLADNSSITQHFFDMKDLVTVFDNFTNTAGEGFTECLYQNENCQMIPTLEWPKGMSLFTKMSKSPCFTQKQL